MDDEESRLERYVLPTLGCREMTNEDLRPRDFRNLIKALKVAESVRGGRLAPRTIRHVYNTVHALMQDAVVDEILPTNPCILKRKELPKKRDKDPAWRATAVFTRSEVEMIISDERIPEDRRVTYAILFLTGMRFGEIAALRWRLYDPTLEPLGRLLVAASWSTKDHVERETKTKVPRQLPVHATLATVLAQWRLGGWQRMMGRPPGPDDLLIPSREGQHRSVNHMLKRFHEDLDRIGLRRRRQHDARRTFVSLARLDGAREFLLGWITHGPSEKMLDEYSTFPWPDLCEAVSCLRIGLHEGKILELPKRAVSAGGNEELGTSLGTVGDVSPNPVQLQALRGRGGRDSNPRPPA
ncbi:MAG: tyrosine-type recombinase/integrase [Deltaproteobacteria bacterium]|nr:tyrosine-type recombinase/integrase [Deltaproteobacteria bacterium]